MKKVKGKHRRISNTFATELDQIKTTRIKTDMDTKFISDARLTEGIIKDPAWKDIKLRLNRMPNKDKLLGSLLDPIIFMVIALLIIILSAGIVFLMSTLTNELIAVDLTIGNVSVSESAQKTVGMLNLGLQGLRIIATLSIFALIVSIFVSNFLLKVHPVFFFPYILVVVLGVVLAVPISNTYETLMNNQVFNGTLASFTAGTWMMLNLPMVVAIVGFFGAIFLFMNIIRDEGLGGSPI